MPTRYLWDGNGGGCPSAASEDPDAVHLSEVFTHATSSEEIRRAYRRYGARFEVDNEGELTLKLDRALDGGVWV
jgi:hypothetical protein